MGHQLFQSRQRHLNVLAFLLELERRDHRDLVDEEPVDELDDLLAHPSVGLQLPTLVPVVEVRLKHELRDFQVAQVCPRLEPRDEGAEVVLVVEVRDLLVAREAQLNATAGSALAMTRRRQPRSRSSRRSAGPCHLPRSSSRRAAWPSRPRSRHRSSRRWPLPTSAHALGRRRPERSKR